MSNSLIPFLITLIRFVYCFLLSVAAIERGPGKQLNKKIICYSHCFAIVSHYLCNNLNEVESTPKISTKNVDCLSGVYLGSFCPECP